MKWINLDKLKNIYWKVYMQATIESFENGVLRNGRRFYIPMYQRNYSWEEKQCALLFEDILKLYNKEYNEHFIGTIVWKPEDSNSSVLGIIDGQQRLTTMFILIKSILDVSEEQRFKDKLSKLLIDDYDNKNRLIPIKNDNQVYELLLKNQISDIKNKDNNIYINYMYFKIL